MIFKALKSSLQHTALALSISALALPLSGFAAAESSLQDTVAQQGSVEVLVGLDMPFTPEGQLTASETSAQWQAIHEKQATFSTDLAQTLKNSGLLSFSNTSTPPPNFITHRFKTIPYVVMEVDKEILSALQESVHVDSIKLREVSQTALSDVASITGANQFYSAGFRGAGQTIAVLDTGSSQTSEFDACFSLHGDCPNGEMVQYGAGAAAPCTFANCEHGSVVTRALQALLPEANIISIQIASNMEGTAGFKEPDQISALEYIYQLHTSGQQTITAINMSLGNSYSALGGDTHQGFKGSCNGSSGENQDARLAIIQNLASAGIAVVAASGNDGFTDSMHKPACYDEVVSVGAVDKEGHIWTGSNRSETLDLLAPGVDVAVTLESGETVVQTGTSLAAPAVTAGIALLKQAHPTSDTAGIVGLLKNTGDASTGISEMQLNAAFTALGLDGSSSDSPILAVATEGTGSVQSSDAVLNCGTNCQAIYALNQLVTLTAQPDADQQFTHWSGDCADTSPNIDVTMDATKICVANFAPTSVQYTFSVEKRNKGNIHVQGYPTCWVSEMICSSAAEAGTTLEIMVTTTSDYEFVGWGGECRGYGNTTQLSMPMHRDINCTAEFLPIPNYPGKVVMTTQIIGKGKVRVSGFECLSGTCQFTFGLNRDAWFKATPASNYQFIQWVGEACPLAGGVHNKIEMTQHYSCTAIFAPEELLSDPQELADFIEDLQFNDENIDPTDTYPVEVVDEALYLFNHVASLVDAQVDAYNPVPWVTHLVDAPMYFSPAGQYVESVTVKADFYILISFVNDAYPQIAVVYGGLDNGSWGTWNASFVSRHSFNYNYSLW